MTIGPNKIPPPPGFSDAEIAAQVAEFEKRKAIQQIDAGVVARDVTGMKDLDAENWRKQAERRKQKLAQGENLSREASDAIGRDSANRKRRGV